MPLTMKDIPGFGPQHHRWDKPEDSTKYLQDAIRAAKRERLSLVLEEGQYAFSDLLGVLDKPCGFGSHGRGVCHLQATPDLNGPALIVEGTADRGRFGIGLDRMDRQLMNKGVSLGGFTLLGDRSTEQAGIIFRGTNGGVTAENLSVYNFNGAGIQVADGIDDDGSRGALRESFLSNIEIYHCGNKEFAAFEWDEADRGDGTNNVKIFGLNIVYPRGKGWRIRNQFEQPVRRCIAYGVMLHGLPTAVCEELGIDKNGTLLELEGYVLGCVFRDLNLNDWGDDSFGVHLKPDLEGRVPTACLFDGEHLLRRDYKNPKRIPIFEEGGRENLFRNIRPQDALETLAGVL